MERKQPSDKWKTKISQPNWTHRAEQEDRNLFWPGANLPEQVENDCSKRADWKYTEFDQGPEKDNDLGQTNTREKD